MRPDGRSTGHPVRKNKQPMELLKDILERVWSGETKFIPASNSEEDIRSFQKVANRLMEAKQNNLIHDVQIHKDSSRGQQYSDIAIVVGGLTFQGEKYLESNSSKPPKFTIESENSLDIFISHSSEDQAIAASFISLLRLALPLDPDRIRCTSVDGHRLPAGASFNEQLRAEVFESITLVALLSPASLQSVFTLFELGARWGAQRFLAPVLVRGASVNSLQQPLASLNAVSSNSEADISNLLVTLANHIKIQAFPYHSYASALHEFCQISSNIM
jgi:hypothetical protein